MATAGFGTVAGMRAVVLDADCTLGPLLAERARLGHDRWDELWDGELHMVPPPSFGHQLLGTRLLLVMNPLADARDLTITYETGCFRVSDDYRQPDVAVFRIDQISHRPARRDSLAVALHTPTGVREPATSEVLGCTFETVATAEGPAVRITWDGGEETVRPGP